MRSSIVLFEDQYKLYKTGSKKLLIAFVEYMFEGIEPDLKPSEMNIFNSLRERMDCSMRAYDSRSKGGKNSHGGPSKNEQNLNQIGTKNEQKTDEKGTENEQKTDENAIQDTNGELETLNSGSNSGTTGNKYKYIVISKDITVDPSTEGKNENKILYEIYPYKSKGYDVEKCNKLIAKQLNQGATLQGMIKEMKLEGLELRIKEGSSYRYGKKLENWLKEYVEGMADDDERLKKLLLEHRNRLENGPKYRKNPREEICELFGEERVKTLFSETKQGIKLLTF